MSFGLLLTVPAAAQEPAPKPVVAFGGVEVRPGGWTLPPPDLSASIIGLLMDDLVSSRAFHVVDANGSCRRARWDTSRIWIACGQARRRAAWIISLLDP
jgi:hypothetical protein